MKRYFLDFAIGLVVAFAAFFVLISTQDTVISEEPFDKEPPVRATKPEVDIEYYQFHGRNWDLMKFKEEMAHISFFVEMNKGVNDVYSGIAEAMQMHLDNLHENFPYTDPVLTWKDLDMDQRKRFEADLLQFFKERQTHNYFDAGDLVDRFVFMASFAKTKESGIENFYKAAALASEDLDRHRKWETAFYEENPGEIWILDVPPLD